MHSGSKKIEQVRLGIYMAVDERLRAELEGYLVQSSTFLY